MTKPIILATIPHTGTQFFRELLSQHLPAIGWHQVIDKRRGLITAHLTDDTMSMLRTNYERVDVVTTARDWDDVWKSWQARGRDMEEDFREYLDRWSDLIAAFDPVIVSVDCVHRDRMLARLSDLVGMTLKTDWKPVNATEEAA